MIRATCMNHLFLMLYFVSIVFTADAQLLNDGLASQINTQGHTSGGAVSSSGDGGQLVSAVGQAASGVSAGNLGDVLISGIPAPKFTPWADGDNDDDGMPNGWESDNGLDPNDPSDANEDDDEDGLTNLEEYLGDTDPQDPNDPPAQAPLASWVAIAALGAAGFRTLCRKKRVVNSRVL